MGRDGWLQQPEQEWSVGGKAAGSVTEFNGLSFVRVYQAVGGTGLSGGGCWCYVLAVPVRLPECWLAWPAPASSAAALVASHDLLPHVQMRPKL